MITLEQVRNVSLSPLVEQLDLLAQAPYVELRWNRLNHLWTVKTEVDGEMVEGIGVTPQDAICKIGKGKW